METLAAHPHDSRTMQRFPRRLQQSNSDDLRRGDSQSKAQ